MFVLIQNFHIPTVFISLLQDTFHSIRSLVLYKISQTGLLKYDHHTMCRYHFLC